MIDKCASIQFLKAFWDDEGCITTDRLRIHGALMSENMIDDIIYLHRKLGIQCAKWKNSSNGSYVISIVNNRANINKFADTINFEFSLITKGKSKGKFK
jgi:LAGLIDADG-like domain